LSIFNDNNKFFSDKVKIVSFLTFKILIIGTIEDKLYKAVFFFLHKFKKELII
jgi:hypothetical protein